MIKSREQRREERKSLRMIVLVTQIGLCMMVPIFLCTWLGRWLSEKTGHPLLFLLILLLGILAGFRTSWQMISRFTGLKLRSGSKKESYSDDVKKEDADDE